MRIAGENREWILEGGGRGRVKIEKEEEIKIEGEEKVKIKREE